MKKFTASICIALAGCATQAQPILPFDIGGSRADGTVLMGVQAAASAAGNIDWEGSEGLVLERCNAWGYSNFQAFSGVRSRFVRNDPTFIPFLGVINTEIVEISREYQCTTEDRIQ
ncbi:MAG: hypothetical protein F4234_11535 [Gammaproteobacteria bacterium]|nr:hypothetical protein [Gammaproteobacteria bacterium]